MKLKLATLATLAALTGACGSNEAKNNRSLGTSEDGLDPRKVHSEDASAASGDDKKGDDQAGQGKDGTDQGEKDGDDTTKKDDQLPPVNTVVVKAGLRNYAQINATMASLTGIAPTNATVKTEYNTNLATSLPTDNDIRAFLGSQQVAVFKLAVEYCDALVKDTTARTAVFGTFNFAATPAAAFNAAGKDALAEALVTKFWGKDLASLPPHAESVDSVVAVIDSLLQGKNLNTVAVTPAVVTAVCTATLAAAPVTMF